MPGYNPNSGYGNAMLHALHSIVPSFGRVHVVFAPDDVGEERLQRAAQVFRYDPSGHIRFYGDTYGLKTALDAVESNNNDVILLDGHGTHALSAGYALTASRVNLIGMDTGGRTVQQGAKVEITGATNTAYVLADSGVRNSFRNIKFIMSSTHANALSVLQLNGEGGLLKNVSAVFGVTNNLGGTTAHEVITGGDSYTIEDCTFGSDVLLTTGARSVFHIKTSTTEFKSNQLKNVRFIVSSSSATATFVRLDTVNDVLFSNLFDDCKFIASVDTAGGIAVAEAVQTGTGTVKGSLLFNRPATFNVTAFSTATSGRNAAIQVVAPVSVASLTVGIKPTA